MLHGAGWGENRLGSGSILMLGPRGTNRRKQAPQSRERDPAVPAAPL